MGKPKGGGGSNGVLSPDALVQRISTEGVRAELVHAQNFGPACAALVEKAKQFKDRGNRCHNEKEFRQAVENYQQVVHCSKWVEQLLLLADQGLPLSDDIREHVREAIAITVLALSNAALSHSRLGEHKMVVKSATKALKWDPKCEKALYRRGIAYLALEDGENAKRDLKDYNDNNKFVQPVAQQKLELAKTMAKEQKRLGIENPRQALAKKTQSKKSQAKKAKKGDDSDDDGPPGLTAAHNSDSDDLPRAADDNSDSSDDGPPRGIAANSDSDGDMPGLQVAESSDGSDSDTPARKHSKPVAKKKDASAAKIKKEKIAKQVEGLNVLNENERRRASEKNAQKQRDMQAQEKMRRDAEQAEQARRNAELARQLQTPEIRKMLISHLKDNQDPQSLGLPFPIPPEYLQELQAEADAEKAKEGKKKKKKGKNQEDDALDLIDANSDSDGGSGDSSDDSDSSSEGERERRKKAKAAKKAAAKKAAKKAKAAAAPADSTPKLKVVPEGRDFLNDFIEKQKYDFVDPTKTPGEGDVVSALVENGYSVESAESMRPTIGMLLKEKTPSVFRFGGEAKEEPAAKGGKPANSAGKAPPPTDMPSLGKKKESGAPKISERQAAAAAAQQAEVQAWEKANQAAQLLLEEEAKAAQKKQEAEERERAKAEKNRQKKENQKKKREEEKQQMIQAHLEELEQKQRIQKAAQEEAMKRKMAEEQLLLEEAEKESLARKKREEEEKKKKRKEEQIREQQRQQEAVKAVEKAQEQARREAEKKAKKEAKKAAKMKELQPILSNNSQAQSREYDPLLFDSHESGVGECEAGYFCNDPMCKLRHSDGRNICEVDDDPDDIMSKMYGVGIEEAGAKTVSDNGAPFENPLPVRATTLSSFQEDELDECVICMDQPRSHCMVPCGHKCVCLDCAEAHFKKQGDKPPTNTLCPMCNTQLIGSFFEHPSVLTKNGYTVFA